MRRLVREGASTGRRIGKAERLGLRPLRSVVGLLAIIVGATCVLVAPTAAGAASSRTSSTAFSSKANQICAQAGTLYGVALETTLESYPPTGAQAAAGIAAGQETLLDRQFKQLKQLKAPPSLNKRFATYVGLIGEQKALVTQEVHAAVGGDQSKYTSLSQQWHEKNVSAEHIASQVKLDQCAKQGLSRKDASTVEHVVTITLITNDPSMCTDMMTKAFVKQQFGSQDKCVEAQTQPAASGTTPSFSDLHGAGNYAQMVVTLHGGSKDGQQLDVSVYRQGGTWRMQAAIPVQPPA